MQTDHSGKLSKAQLFTVLKISERCNLKCPYCYFFFAGDESYKDNPANIPSSIVESTADFLLQGAEDLNLSRIDVSLHGGEPLMIGKRRFREVCETFYDRFGRDNASFGMNIQTNGVLIDREWVDIFEEYKIGVGVSLDGPKHIHDQFRIDKTGKGTYDETKNGIELLNDSVGAGALIVIPKGVSGTELFNHVVNDLGLKAIDFLFPIQNWDDHDPMLTEDVTRFYKEVFDAWIALDDPSVEIRTLSDRLRAMLTDSGAMRRTNGLMDLCDSITIRSNGDLCPDDVLHSINERYRNTGYSVRSNSLSEFMSAPFWDDMRQATAQPTGNCQGCKWWAICRGGDLEHRFSADQKFKKPSTYCDTYKSIHEDLFEYASQAVSPTDIERRLDGENLWKQSLV